MIATPRPARPGLRLRLRSRLPSFLRTRRRWLLAGLVCGALAAAGVPFPAAADEPDQERARRAVQAGEVLPLHQVLERVARAHPGQVLEVELEQSQGRWIYEIRLLQPDGRLVKLVVDARNAELLRQKGPRPGAR